MKWAIILMIVVMVVVLKFCMFSNTAGNYVECPGTHISWVKSNDKTSNCYDDENLKLSILNGKTEVTDLYVQFTGSKKPFSEILHIEPMHPNDNFTIVLPLDMKKYGDITHLRINPMVGRDVCEWGISITELDRCN